MANQIQHCKLPSPRELGTDETRENLTNWLDTAQNFFLRDDPWARFVRDNAVWNPAAANHGFAADPHGARLNRGPAEVYQSFLRFCSAFAAFFPFGYIKTTLETETTGWASIREQVYIAYNRQLNAASLLGHVEFKRDQGENYYIYFRRLMDFYKQHLVGPNVQAAGFDTGAQGDGMTLSHANLVAMIWLERIDKRLPKLVLREYGNELRRQETHLVSLVPRISTDMEALLEQLEEASKINRFSQRSFNNGGGNRRGGNNFGGGRRRGGRGGRGDGRGRGADDRQSHCSHCQHLGREMQMQVDYNHSPLECRRRRVQVRLIQDDEQQMYQQNYDNPEDEYYDHFEDAEEYLQDYGASSSSSLPDPNLVSLQSEQSGERVPSSSPRQSHGDILSCPLFPLFSTATASNSHNTFRVSDLTLADLESLNCRVRRTVRGVPTKTESPLLRGTYRGKPFLVVIDSGSELNCLDYRFVQDMNIPFEETDAGATAAGDNPVQVAGVVKSDFIFNADFRGQNVPINCQRAVVVHSLGSDVLFGEPGKQFNALETCSSQRTIHVRYKGSKYHTPYISAVRKEHSIARIRESATVYPGQRLAVPVPAELARETVLLCTPRKHQHQWYSPGFYKVSNGFVELANETNLPVNLSRTKPVGDVRTCVEVRAPGPAKKQIGHKNRHSQNSFSSVDGDSPGQKQEPGQKADVSRILQPGGYSSGDEGDRGLLQEFPPEVYRAFRNIGSGSYGGI